MFIVSSTMEDPDAKYWRQIPALFAFRYIHRMHGGAARTTRPRRRRSTADGGTAHGHHQRKLATMSFPTKMANGLEALNSLEQELYCHIWYLVPCMYMACLLTSCQVSPERVVWLSFLQ